MTLDSNGPAAATVASQVPGYDALMERLPWATPKRVNAVLRALADAGYTLNGPDRDTWTCHRCGKVHYSSADYGDHLLAGVVQECKRPAKASERCCPRCGWGLHGTICGKCDWQATARPEVSP